LLPPSKLSGELEPSAFAGSYRLLPPSGRAQTEGVDWNSLPPRPGSELQSQVLAIQ
jgi:hypothetical protein